MRAAIMINDEKVFVRELPNIPTDDFKKYQLIDKSDMSKVMPSYDFIDRVDNVSLTLCVLKYIPSTRVYRKKICLINVRDVLVVLFDNTPLCLADYVKLVSPLEDARESSLKSGDIVVSGLSDYTYTNRSGIHYEFYHGGIVKHITSVLNLD